MPVNDFLSPKVPNKASEGINYGMGGHLDCDTSARKI